MYKIMYGTKIVCSTNKKQNRQKKKKRGEYNGLLTHFICRVNMIVCLPGSETMGTGMTTMPWVWVRVRVLHVKKSRVRIRDQVHGYRYKLSYPDNNMYGYG